MLTQRMISIVACMILFIADGICQDKVTVAILDLEATGVPAVEVQSIGNRVRQEIFLRDEYTVVERAAMEEILTEQGFQLSGCVSSQCAVEAGRLLGVQRMVAGSVDKVGRLYTIHLRLIDVQTGEVLSLASADCECPIEKVALTSTPDVVTKLMMEHFKESSEKVSFSESQIKTQSIMKKKPERIVFISPRLGMSWFSGILGLELQISHLAFDYGTIITDSFAGVKYLFSVNKSCWFLGASYFHITTDSPRSNFEYGVGGAVGYQWIWQSGFSFSLAGGIATWYGRHNNQEPEFRPAGEIVVGYRF